MRQHHGSSNTALFLVTTLAIHGESDGMHEIGMTLTPANLDDCLNDGFYAIDVAGGRERGKERFQGMYEYIDQTGRFRASFDAYCRNAGRRRRRRRGRS